MVQRPYGRVAVPGGRLGAGQAEARRDHTVVGAPHRVVKLALVGVTRQLGRRGQRQLGGQLAGQRVQYWFS